MNEIRKICIHGFVVRSLTLCFVLLFSNHLTTGYLRSTTISDDVRYEQGALIYSKVASNVIDVNAFAIAFSSVDDNIWLSDSIQVWYWIVCILTYIFKSSVIVKLINILFSVICIYLIYKLSKIVYFNNEKIAILAAKLYAYCPFPVIFCCFLYKDQFLTLVLLTIFYFCLKVDNILKPWNVAKLVSLLLLFNFLRSGLLPVLILCIGILELKKRESSFRLNSKSILLILLTVVGVYLLYSRDSSIIMHKIDAYVLSRANDQSLNGHLISNFFINDIFDIWKLPLAYIFTLVQPFYLGGLVINWESFTSIFNCLFIPVAVGNLIYIFRMKKTNNHFWICVMILYAVMLLVSLGVGRHYYYLLPYTMMFFSDYYVNGNSRTKVIHMSLVILSVIYFVYCLPALLSIN